MDQIFSERDERRKQGFAVADPVRRREIARRGGRAAQANGRAHRWTAAEATRWAPVGGQARHSARRYAEADVSELRGSTHDRAFPVVPRNGAFRDATPG